MSPLSKCALYALTMVLGILLTTTAQAQSKPQRRAEFRALSMKDENGNIPADALMIAKAQADALKRPAPKGGIGELGAGITTASWQALGPGNIGGRVRAIAVHPTNPNRIVMGAVSGGIWTSNDAGVSWTKVDDWLPSLSISSIVYDPQNPLILYAGTGESFVGSDYSTLGAGGGASGAGILKSVDGGARWSRLVSTNPSGRPDWEFVNRLAIHPSNPQRVYAALTGTATTPDGIKYLTNSVYVSNDAGANWSKLTNLPASGTRDLKINPANASHLIVSDAVSFDAGATWIRSIYPAANGSRIELAFDSNGAIYSSGGDGNFYRSIDGGRNWTLRSTTFGAGQQGDYNNALWIDPQNPNTILIGRQYMMRSVDAGLTWTAVGQNCFDVSSSFHADQHIIVSPSNYNTVNNRVVYVGNDGGIYKANDVLAVAGSCGPTNGWTNLNNGLNITQFTGGAGSNSTLFGGTQDNGSLVRTSGTTWSRYAFGDGGPTAYSAAAPGWLHGSFQAGYSAHTYANYASNPDADLASNASYTANCNFGGLFYRPLSIHPSSSAMYSGMMSGLCATENPNNFNPVWRQVTTPSLNTTFATSSITVGASSPSVVWYSGYDLNEPRTTRLFKSNNALSVSPPPTWTNITANLPNRVLTRIHIDERFTNQQVAYVSFGGFTNSNIWKTTNGGANWTNIHGTLPAVPIRAITTHPTIPGYLYVGTEVGIFTSENGGASWYLDINNQPQNDGPANVSVEHLFWTDNQTLIAATYGRGMFKAVIGAPVCNLDIDRNGTITPFRDGILILRNMAGLTGAALVQGVAGSPDPNLVTPRIEAIKSLLDIDGNGSVDLPPVAVPVINPRIRLQG